MEKVEVNGKYTWLDFVGANALVRKPTGHWGIIHVVSILVFFNCSLSQIGAIESVPLFSAPYGVFLLVGTYFVIQRLRTNQQHKEEWHQDKHWNADFDVTATSKDILWKNAYVQKQHPWDHFVRWQENEEFLLIFLSYANCWILPKRLFLPDELHFLKLQLDANDVEEKHGKTLLWESVLWIAGGITVLLIRLYLN